MTDPSPNRIQNFLEVQHFWTLIYTSNPIPSAPSWRHQTFSWALSVLLAVRRSHCCSTLSYLDVSIPAYHCLAVLSVLVNYVLMGCFCLLHTLSIAIPFISHIILIWFGFGSDFVGPSHTRGSVGEFQPIEVCERYCTSVGTIGWLQSHMHLSLIGR